MKNTWLVVLAVLLMAIAAGCRKENKAEQLAALDNAYQSGVLRKGEYDAKRLALGQPAPASAAPVTPAASAKPATAAQNPPAETISSYPAFIDPQIAAPAVPALATPKPATPKAAPVVTRPQAATKRPVPAQAAPLEHTPAPPDGGQLAPPAQPPVAPPVHVPRPPSEPVSPAPQSSAAGAAEAAPLAGCEDAEYKSGKVKGSRQRFYPAPMEAVKRAAGAALGSLDFNIHKDGGNVMEASKRRHIGAIVGAGGERLILHFEKAQQGNQTGTVVTSETKKSFVGRVAQKSWTHAVLAQIACQLRSQR